MINKERDAGPISTGYGFERMLNLTHKCNYFYFAIY